MSENIKSKYFEKSKVILVEGKGDKNFFEVLCKEKLKIKDIQIFQLGGKGEFKIKSKYLSKIPGYNNIQKLGLVLDADNSFSATQDSIKYHISKLNISVSNNPNTFSNDTIDTIKFSYFIMPDNNNSGMIENICINSSRYEKVMEHSKNFLEKIQTDDSINKKPKNTNKALVNAYLSMMEETCSEMFFGLRKNYWNIKTNEFKEIIKFVKSFSE